VKHWFRETFPLRSFATVEWPIQSAPRLLLVSAWISLAFISFIDREVTIERRSILALTVQSRWVDRSTEKCNAQNPPMKMKEIYLRQNEYFALYLHILIVWDLSILLSRYATAWVEHPAFPKCHPMNISRININKIRGELKNKKEDTISNDIRGRPQCEWSLLTWENFFLVVGFHHTSVLAGLTRANSWFLSVMCHAGPAGRG
jgi:hypothetical protein